MTKRFTMKRSMIDGEYYIYDNQTDFQFPTIPFGITEIFCQRLNNISEENEQLKLEINNILKNINGNECLKNKDCFKTFNRLHELSML